MSSKLKVLQVIPKLGYGGAETGCYDLAHYLHEQNAKSYIVTSCLLYTSPSPRDRTRSRMPSSA